MANRYTANLDNEPDWYMSDLSTGGQIIPTHSNLEDDLNGLHVVCRDLEGILSACVDQITPLALQ